RKLSRLIAASLNFPCQTLCDQLYEESVITIEAARPWARLPRTGKEKWDMLVRAGALGDLGRLLHQLAHTAASPSGATIPVDAWRDDEAPSLQFDLPGTGPVGIDLSVERNPLPLVAERRSPSPVGARPILSERLTGRFTRRMALSDALDPDSP